MYSSVWMCRIADNIHSDSNTDQCIIIIIIIIIIINIFLICLSEMPWPKFKFNYVSVIIKLHHMTVLLTSYNN